jgi:hypothetical protein
MTHLRFVHAVLLAALFLAAPASVSGKLMSLPYSVGGHYELSGGVSDPHFFPGQQGFNLGDFAPDVNDVVDYSSGDISASVGPVIGIDGSGSTNAHASITVHGQLGSFKIKTIAKAFSQRITNDCPLCPVRALAQSEGTVDVVDWVEFSSNTASSMIVNTKWTISYFSGDNKAGEAADADASAIGTYHDQAAIGASDYTQSTAASFLTVTGTGIAPAPYKAYGAGGLSAPSAAYAVSWATAGGYDLPPTIDHIQQDPPASIPISFRITAGVPLHVSWTFDVGSGAQVENNDLTPGSGVAASYMDFTHTANWGGITSVIDADTGEPVTDWTMDSASGFDYLHPFLEPEPSSIVLTAIGAVAIAGVVRLKPTPTNLAK